MSGNEGAAPYRLPMGDAPMTQEQALAEAERRYLMDAEHHARVTLCVRSLDLDLHKRTGQYLNSEDRNLATIAASLGVLLAHVDPATGRPGQT